MKLTFLLVVIMAIQAHAGIYAQNAKLSINMENVSVKQIIKEIKKKSEFSFVYSDVDIKELKKTNVNFNNVGVEKILNKCLQGSDLAIGFLPFVSAISCRVCV